MSDTGIVRRIDSLGRIVIPMEFRRTLGIHVHDQLSIRLEGEQIAIGRHRDTCAICGAEGDMVAVKDRSMCPACVGAVKGL
jgi:transcriptional pleiotropic regulator of transition state genes